MSEIDWVAEVKLRLVYNYESDTVHWRLAGDPETCGQRLHDCARNGYRAAGVRFAGKQLLIHRIVWVLVHGEDAQGEIDHIDGDKANNSRWNLRDVSKSINLHNNKAKGYNWHPAAKKWHARIRINNVQKSLGFYTTEEEAKAVYLKAKAAAGLKHRHDS
jgi:hypothetical protein